MKKIIIAIAIATGLSSIFIYYLYFGKKQEDINHIPELLERSGPVSLAHDWKNTKIAIERLRHQIEKQPADLTARLNLALAYMQEARVTGERSYYYPVALELLDHVINYTNNHGLMYEAKVSKAAVQLSLHQFDKSLQTAREVLSMKDDNSVVYEVLCDAYMELGSYEEAVPMADKLVQLRADVKSYSRVSYLKEIYGDIKGAISVMEMATNAAFSGLEQNAWTRVKLGELHEARGELDDAEMHYQITLEQMPFYSFALAGLGRIEFKKGNYRKAEEYYTKAVAIMPEFSFKEQLAELYKTTGKKEKAEKLVTETISMLKKDKAAGLVVDLELARVYADLANDYKTAMIYAEEAYKKRPKNIEVCKVYAGINYKLGRMDKAKELLSVASRTNSMNCSLLCISALVACKTGDVSGASYLARKSFAIDPYQKSNYALEAKQLLNSPMAGL